VVTLRRAEPADAEVLADLYLRSFRWGLPTVTLAHDDADVHRWFRDVVVPLEETWVAAGDHVLGLLVLTATMVESLYVEPAHTGDGIGTLLLDQAKLRRPEGLELWAFQDNARARRFYERHGFVAVEFGDGSGNEEGAPDVRYRWTPSMYPA
jgi:GNAT superfamily N-acetyltransferase